MTYLPELRESLVRAAEHAATPSGSASRRRSGLRAWARRAPLGSIALGLASVTAVAVAGLVLVLAGHRNVSPPATAGAVALTPGYGDPAAADAAARKLLARFSPPAGAVPMASGSGALGHRLTEPTDVFDTTRGVSDAFRYWHLPGSVDSVMNGIDMRMPEPRSWGSGSATDAASSGAGGNDFSFQTTTSFYGPASPFTPLLRALEVQAAPARGGGTILRVDAQARWGVARPVNERLPNGVTRIEVQLLGPIPAQLKAHRAHAITDAKPVARVVALINSLAVVQPHLRDPGATAAGACQGVHIRATFLASGQPRAVAVIDPACSTVRLTLDGRGQPPLSTDALGGQAVSDFYPALWALTGVNVAAAVTTAGGGSSMSGATPYGPLNTSSSSSATGSATAPGR